MLKYSLIISFCLLGFTSNIQTDEVKSFEFGSRYCKVIIKGESENDAIFVSLHDNENTSVIAFKEVSEQINRPILIELQQNGGRNLKYGFNGKDYLIDPNRIFSEIGLENSLKKNNNTYPKEIIAPIKDFASKLLAIILPKSRLNYIVAIHNNSNDNFSVKYYAHSSIAEKTYINPNEDVDDFFYVTERSDFEFFKSKKRNVILQSKNVFDDGSLSVYCGRNNLPYINIEAQDGHKEVQKQMIKEAYFLIKSKQP